MGEKLKRVTRKQIKEYAKRFPDLYEIKEEEHGFEVIRKGELRRCSVFFWNGGPAMRTDLPHHHAREMKIGEGARVLGILWVGE